VPLPGCACRVTLHLAEDEFGQAGKRSVRFSCAWSEANIREAARRMGEYIEMDLEDPEVIRAFSQIHVWPIDLPICQKLRSLDFRGDPADEMIAAMSIVHRAPLVTRDSAIRKSKLVPLAS